MGEVYEAEDQELGERLALKVLKPEIAADAALVERFKREILLARRVTHPNVCRVFDLGRHTRTLPDGGAAPEGPVTYLTMELLEGETLAERLEQKGRLAPEEAVPLLRQIAGGLEAAHRAGVIHRDFKSSNVILVPSRTGERAVVTDFGLAREAISSGDGDLSLTHRGEVIGTPAYMAPEQVEGDPVTVRSDLYSFGVVMYELLTGKRPFVGRSPLSTAILRLKQPPAPPRIHVPQLPDALEAIVLKCLKVDPAERYQTAAELVAALEAMDRTRKWPKLGGGKVTKRRLVQAAAVVAGLTLAAGVWWLIAELRARSPASAAARRSVAVLGFKNLTGSADAAWLSTAVSEMLKTELAAGGMLRILSGEQVERMKIELGLADSDTLAEDTLRSVGAYLNAELVVLGSFISLGTGAGTQVRLDLRVQDTGTGETLSSLAVSGAEGELFQLVSDSGRRLREALGVESLSADEQAGLVVALPPSSTVARLYSEGLRRLRRFDAEGAREILAQAVAADPEYPLSHAALAAAWSALGYDENARREAKAAHDLAAGLGREAKLTVEGRYREVAGEWERAAEIYRTLWTFYPDNLEYGLRFAEAEVSAGKGLEALATVAELRRLPAPSGDDPRIDLCAAQAARSLSDYRQQLEESSAAVRKGEQQGARLLAANARLAQGAAIQVLEGPEQARRVFEEAMGIYERAGDRGSVARALGHIADVLMRQGDVAAARARYEEALAIFRQIGDRRGTAATLSAIAWLLYGQEGDLAGAEQRHEEALAIFQEIGDRENTAVALRNLGGVLWRRGDADAARARFSDALALFRQLNNRQGESAALRSLGWLALIRGQLGDARAAVEEALAIDRGIEDRRGEGRNLQVLAMVLHAQGLLEDARRTLEQARLILDQMSDRSGVALVEYGLGRVSLDQGDLAAAVRHHEQALEMRQAMNETTWVAESRLALAEALVEQGQLGRALELQRAALDGFGEETQPDGRAWTHAAIARTLLLQGDLEGAASALEKAGDYGESGPRMDVRLSVALVAARVAAASGHGAEARASLRRVAEEAAAAGMVRSELEARLALAELEVRSDDVELGRRLLEELRADATRRSFGLVAAKAARVLESL